MSELGFSLTVDGERVDARRLECHFQSDPYPGGHHYCLVIRDAEVISDSNQEFGAGVHQEIEPFKAIGFLSYLGGIKSIKIGRENPPLFWANTIDRIDVANDQVILTGVCSPHVSE